MKIEIDDLTRPAILALLNEHLTNMYELSPPESVHALDVSKLKSPDITFWTVWDDDHEGRPGALLGCGALKRLSDDHGELKSMRTASTALGGGVGSAMLDHLVAAARAAGMTRLSLETGNSPAFAAAHRLYQREGFARCGPFADYRPTHFTTFYTREI